MILPFTSNQFAWFLRIIFPILTFIYIQNLLSLILVSVSVTIWIISILEWNDKGKIKFRGSNDTTVY